MEKKVSRQRKWQLRQRELGNCIICGHLAALTRRRHAKRARSVYCETHQAMTLEMQRRRTAARKDRDAKAASSL